MNKAESYSKQSFGFFMIHANMKFLPIEKVLILVFLLSIEVSADENKMNQSKMLGLRTVAYQVDNLEAAVEWYTKAFGVSPYAETPEYVGFNIRGFELGLMPETEVSSKGTNITALWGVEDIDLEYKRLIELGAKADSPIVNVGGDIRVGTVKDPFGNILGIIYNPIFELE